MSGAVFGIPTILVVAVLAALSHLRGWRHSIQIALVGLFFISLAGTALGSTFLHVGSTVLSAFGAAAQGAVSGIAEALRR